ncbi:uncharacterized protein LOC124550840 isoform X1 [Schistocerca americana]|uniref:uncharacterized protein LOC124550840 isoform X1 n=1 Tax=Schistocerca americana TaxID=7009 RepID=UPI001F4FF094|nr:uncharacterized protein LOC124550840 isoform X1 [Schistocerca americana]
MDWRVRIAWWLLVVLLLASVTTPAEGGRGGGSRGGGSRGGGGRGSGSTWSRNRNRNSGSDSHSYKHVTSKPVTQRYSGKLKTTPKTKDHWSSHYTTSRPIGWKIPPLRKEDSGSANSIGGHRYKPTEDSRKAVTEKYNRHYKPTEAVPVATTHRHRHGHQNHTKSSISKHDTTSSHNVSRHGGNLWPFQPTQRPSLHTKAPVTSSYNRSRDAFQAGGIPGHLQPSQEPSHRVNHWPPLPASTTGPIGWNVPGTNHQGSHAQPPGPGWNLPGTNTNKQPPGPGFNIPGTNTNKQPPGPGFNVPGTNPNQQGSHAQAPGPGWNVPGGSAKQQPSASDLNPPHQAQQGWNVGSGTGSKTADYPRQPPYNPNYHGTQQAPPPYNPNYHGTQQAPPPYNPNYHGTQQAPPPYSPPGHAPPAYNPNQPPPAYSPGHPPAYPGYPTHQAGYPGYQQGYSGYQNHPGGYSGYPGHYGGYHQGYPSYSGGGGGGGGYYGYQQGYPGSPGFGHYPGGYYPGGGSQWSPPGYTSSYSMMPGLFGGYGGGGGGFFSSSYHSSPFGYSKSYFRPSFPMIIFLPMPHYHYPPSIPPRRTWGCDCYVQDKTAVCTYKLKDDHIPSCVSSSVTAVFIQSREVDRLSVDAFRHVPRLEYLNITDTKLRSLPRDLFRDTRDLKHLLVQNNPNLRSLDNDVFRDASKLEDVILDRNDISSLDRDVFTHLTNVKRLNLAYNKIRSLPEGIFRDNRELQELGLSGNPLRITADTARDLLRNNAKLRVLLMRDCKLEDLPTGLLRNASNLEWLDLSSNDISQFPSDFIQDCTKLAYLGLAYNKLKVLSSDVLHQRGGSLATLALEGNPWRCDCNLLPLAGWATLRKDAVPGRPKCSSPHDVEDEPLQRWFHSKDAMKCGGATTSLRTDLNRVLSVARAIAKQGPSFFANLLPVSDEEVGFTATNYFSYAMAARTDADVDSVVWHWARFLEKVLDRRHLRYSKLVAEKGIDQIGMDRMLLLSKETEKDPLKVNIDVLMDPLTTTTSKPPAARAIERPLRPKGFEPLVNFTYIMNNVPENITKVVDDGIEEELKILFGVINGTNATSPNATAANATASNSTGNITTGSPNTTIAATNVTLAPFLQNSAPVTTTPASLAPAVTSTPSPSNLSSVMAVSTSTPLSPNASIVMPVNTIPNTTSLVNGTSPDNRNVTNSTSSLAGLNATAASANGTSVPPKKLNATEQVVAGLRSELREVLSTLLLSIDRAKWDAAYQKSVKEEEEKAKKSPQPPNFAQQPKPPTAEMNTRVAGSSAESCVLMQPRLTVLIAFLTLLAHPLV